MLTEQEMALVEQWMVRVCLGDGTEMYAPDTDCIIICQKPNTSSQFDLTCACYTYMCIRYRPTLPAGLRSFHSSLNKVDLPLCTMSCMSSA